MKFNKCILHIGMEKTGSTTIQRFLEKNREELQAQGHYYPKCLGPTRGSHYYLVVYSRDDTSFDDLRLITSVTNKNELFNFRKNLDIKISEELNSVEQCHTLHVSCENLQSRLLGVAAIEKVRNLLAPYVKDFSVLCYLRPQHEVALSLYSTDMKLGGVPKEPIPIVDSNNHYYNYKVMIDKWKDVFGLDNIFVKSFQREKLVGRDIILDYIDFCSIDGKKLVPLEKENESLSPEGLEFLGQINRFLPRFVDGRPSGLRKNIADLMEKTFPGRGATASRHKVRRFYFQFSESNNQVAFQYTDEKQLFDVDLEKYPNDVAAYKLDQKSLINLFVIFFSNVAPRNIENLSTCAQEIFYPPGEFTAKKLVEIMVSNGYSAYTIEGLTEFFCDVWTSSDFYFLGG